MKLNFKFISTTTFINLMFTRKKYNVQDSCIFTSNHANFKQVKELLQHVLQTQLYVNKGRISQEDYESFKLLADRYAHITNWSSNKLVITRDGATYNGKKINQDIEDFLVQRFLADPTDNEAFSAWEKFIENTSDEQLDYKVTNRLFMFLSKKDLTITKEGKVLAWKVITSDYKDKYTRTIDNSIGQTVTMARNQVDSDDTQTCSYGLHVCSFDYLSGFASHGDVVVQVEIDVKDIVAIPLDYAGDKIRVCEYRVLREAGIWGSTVTPDVVPTFKDEFSTSI